MSTDISQLYWSLIRARLKDHVCRACGASLEHAIVTSAGDGTALDEYGLSEVSAARLLAATEALTVECLRCQSMAEIGTPPPPAPMRTSPSVDDLTPWSARAIEVYRSILRTRLSGRNCPHCGGSLEAAKVRAPRRVPRCRSSISTTRPPLRSSVGRSGSRFAARGAAAPP